jgi:hypothetical protein
MPGRVGAAAVALLVAAGCGGSGKSRVAPAPETTTAVGCSTPATTDVAESARAASTTATGDFDGDGRADRLVTFRVGSGGPWRVRVELAAGGGDELALPAPADGVRALGGTRLDVGPGEAALVVVAGGPSGSAVGLFVLQGCRLARVTLNGVPAELPVRSGPTARDGLACQPPGLVAYSATSTDGQVFRGTTVGYLLVGASLDEAHRATQTLGAGDPELPRFATLACGTLKLA